MSTATLPTPTTQRREIPGGIRSVVGGGRSRDAILATDSAVRVYDYSTGKVIYEVLLIEGESHRDGPIPFLVDHSRAIPSQIGSVSDVRKTPGELQGTLHFARTNASSEAWLLVSDGHARSLSVGYSIDTAVMIPRGRSQSVAGKVFTAPADLPLRVVSAWTLREVSLVTIPADEKAGIRSLTSSRSQSMSLSATIPTRNLDQMRLADLAAVTLRSRGITPPDDAVECLHAAFPLSRSGLSTVDGAGDLFDQVTTWCLDGWRRVPDSLDGIYRIESASNYLEHELAAASVHPRMGRIARGQIAPHANFAVSSEKAQLMKFGLQFAIDEQDAINGGTLGVWRIAVEEALRFARGLVSDLMWSVLLSNPTLADGTALFHTDRGNLGTVAFGDVGLQTAIQAITSQVGEDENGAPVHYGLRPRVVVVPPALLWTAWAKLRTLVVDGSEIASPRAESRMGTTGVLDPRDGSTLHTGSHTQWLAAALGEQKASIVLSLLNGKTEPTIRTFSLDNGQWGVGFDISFSCAVTAVSGAPLYFSTGAGD